MSLWRELTRGLRALINRTRSRSRHRRRSRALPGTRRRRRSSGAGLSPKRRGAQRDWSSAASAAVREQVRDVRVGEHVIDTVAADVALCARAGCAAPGLYGLVAALTLALGIGASTAIFSAVKPILLQPLPYPDAGRLILIWDGQDGADEVTFGTYRELVERSRSFESIAVMRPLQLTLTGVGEPERAQWSVRKRGLLSSAGGATCTRTRFPAGRRRALDPAPSSPSSVTRYGTAVSAETRRSSVARSRSRTSP